MKKIIVILSTSIIFLTLLLSGCLGAHQECPRCEGSGRDPGTFFFTECPNCDGDGEVGLYMDDEGLEDTLSFVFVMVFIIVIVVLWMLRRR